MQDTHTYKFTCVSCNKNTATNCPALGPTITSPGDVVLDPMCGKGTLLAEAAIWWPEGRYIGCETRQELGMGAKMNVISKNVGFNLVNPWIYYITLINNLSMAHTNLTSEDFERSSNENADYCKR